jgi:hypothetical protein
MVRHHGRSTSKKRRRTRICPIIMYHHKFPFFRVRTWTSGRLCDESALFHRCLRLSRFAEGGLPDRLAYLE